MSYSAKPLMTLEKSVVIKFGRKSHSKTTFFERQKTGKMKILHYMGYGGEEKIFGPHTGLSNSGCNLIQK